VQETVVNQQPGDWPPDQRAELISLLKDAGERDDRLCAHLREWSRAEPRAASEWVAAQGLHQSRDIAVEGLVLGTAPSDPGGAALWAEEIAEPGLRERMARLAFGYWMESDPGAAVLAAQDSSLSADALQSILHRTENGGEP
jgi:hypothetical protein